MKSLLQKDTREEVIRRIDALDERNTSTWGKMNLAQMLRHCILWEEMVLRNKKYKRVFIGKIIGKWVLRNVLKDGATIGRNAPTIPDLIVKEEHEPVNILKDTWIGLIDEYAIFSDPVPAFIHPFFGKMSKEQIGVMAYKHSDHHLKQFNA